MPVHSPHLGPTLMFFSNSITVQEGVDEFAYIQLVMTNVPMDGLEGVIEYELSVFSQGASECYDFCEYNPPFTLCLFAAAVIEDYLVDISLSVSFGEPGVTTSRADLEGSLSTVAQIVIVDDEILDESSEQILVLTPNNAQSLRITILDDESKFSFCYRPCVRFLLLL